MKTTIQRQAQSKQSKRIKESTFVFVSIAESENSQLCIARQSPRAHNRAPKAPSFKSIFCWCNWNFIRHSAQYLDVVKLIEFDICMFDSLFVIVPLHSRCRPGNFYRSYVSGQYTHSVERLPKTMRKMCTCDHGIAMWTIKLLLFGAALLKQ